MKNIPKKNYIIAVVLMTLTFLIVGYFAFWYTETREYNANNSIMTGYLLEIGEDEVVVNLSNYILDNPNIVLYMSYGNDSSVKSFENEFKQFINKNNIKSNFVYIDLNRIEDKSFFDNFKNDFFNDDLKNKNIEISKQSNLFTFKDGKVVNSLYYTKQAINMSDVKFYLKNQGVIDND